MNISGLDKVKVLQALYEDARVQGLGFIHFVPGPLAYEEAKALLAAGTYFDYLKGRVMKIDLKGDEVETRLYNEDNGPGAAEQAIAQLRRLNA